jgi:hypothetical protein
MNKSLSIQDIKPTKQLLGDIKLNFTSSNMNKENNLHFTRNLLEILNKAFVASSSSASSHLSEKFWFNNQHVYQLIESCICDFYAERFDINHNSNWLDLKLKFFFSFI